MEADPKSQIFLTELLYIQQQHKIKDISSDGQTVAKVHFRLRDEYGFVLEEICIWEKSLEAAKLLAARYAKRESYERRVTAQVFFPPANYFAKCQRMEAK